MENQKLVLSLLFLVVIASGCSDGGGGETTSEGKGAINVHRLNVQPTQIYQGKTVGVSMDIVNGGNLPAKFDPGDKGERVMKDYCPDIFENSLGGYHESTPATDMGGYYLIEPKQQIKLRWQLNQKGNVPLYDLKCDLKFEVPFNYTVRAYKQIQIKKERGVEASQLNSESSAGPLFLAIETIGSTAKEGQSTFIAEESGEDKEFQILIQLQNQEAEDYGKGVVDIDEGSLFVQLEGPVSSMDFREEYGSFGSHCGLDNDAKLRIFEGKSRVITCTVDLPKKTSLSSSPSVVSEISAGVNYTYIKDAGSRTVTVKYSGN